MPYDQHAKPGEKPLGSDNFQLAPPSISLPKGGGAIRGIGEKFSANPVTGTGSMIVPIVTSPGRGGFGPQLGLSYDSGSGNGPFGFGWQLSQASITRRTDKGLPRYEDANDSDVFILSGAEDLVPEFKKDANDQWVKDSRNDFVCNEFDSGPYRIRSYRPRIEGLFARLERWTNRADSNDVFWRSISKENIATFYGKTSDSRIVDPSDASKIFSWLICESYDDKGNAIQYKYKPEDGNLSEPVPANERNRKRLAQRYLKYIKYGNQTPRQPNEDLDLRKNWLFEVVFDYGDHDAENPKPKEATAWLCRNDPFSSYRSRFEVRTYRLCQRVLMFHHFPLEGIGSDCLVKSTDFVYRDTRGNPDDTKKGNPLGSFLATVTQTAYKAGCTPKSMPPLHFEYSEARIQEQVREVDADSLINLPTGLDGTGYQWVDLDGEGIPGILSEQANAWLYKRNVSPISIVKENDVTRNAATFGPMEVVAEKPAFASTGTGGWQFQDLAGEGKVDLARFEGAVPGFFERNENEENHWDNFVAFRALPNVNWHDPNLRFVDLTGDGLADILITEDQAFTWYPSLGETGFAQSERSWQAVDEEDGPHLVFADGEQSIYLADLSGDGLTDLVRIRNGEVCYWPNLGYGQFGAKVTMDNAPLLDAPDQFSPDRVRLADIDGSGVTDILYLGRDGIRAYFNQSGNSWSTDQRIWQLPPADNVTAVQVVDLFGNGTACLVWSSPLPGEARRPMRYIDLMGGQKPHLLVSAANNLGLTTHITYAPSTKFYLRDKAVGRPCITKLPFPVHVVEKVTVTDKWRHSQFSTTYSYHHGYFDGPEREFRGFGRVEQVDTEDYGTFAQGNQASPYITNDQTLYQPPVKTVSWFHTGAALDRERILTQFESEYFPNSLAALPNPLTIDNIFNEKPLPEPDLESLNLTDDEWREALRACKGMALRQEVYELDVDALQPSGGEPPRQIPTRLFSAATHNCDIRCLQPRGDNQHAVFLVTESEAISYHYELDLRPPAAPPVGTTVQPLEPDPRVAHTLNLLLDEYGNIQQSVAVGYSRCRQFDDPDLAAYADLIRETQTEVHIAYNETHYTRDVIGSSDPLHPLPIQYQRLRVPCEVQTYELTGFSPAHGTYFDLSDFHGYKLSDTLPNQGATVVARKLYHEFPQGMSPTMRLVEHTRTLFFKNDLSGPLGLGTFDTLGLPYEHYKLALTRKLLDAVFSGGQLDNSISAGGTARDALDNWQISGYLSEADAAAKFGVPAAGEYWMRSGVAGFAGNADQHFYLPNKYTDPFNNSTTLQYDGKYDLFIQSSSDALSNTTSVARFDYRILAPAGLTDINGNHTEAYFDVLGRVIAVAVEGKGNEADNLVGYDDTLANPQLSQILPLFNVPSLKVDEVRDLFSPMLGNATSRFLYHFGEKIENGKTVWEDHPAGACSIAREQHVAEVAALRDTDPTATSPLQVAFECSDGMGTVLMKRSQAEPQKEGGSLRWIVSGKTVLNNKGKPVKQYEPYFSENASCCAEGDVHEEAGVTPIMYYDAVGRLVRTELPDGTLSRVEFSPWLFKTYDANDTVLESQWYADRGSPGGATSAEPTDPDARAAWLAAVHSKTPAQSHLDSLGREVIAIAHNRIEDSNGTITISGRHWHDEWYLTFTRLDAEGKPLWIRDARGNLVMQYVSPPKSNRDKPRVPRDFSPTGNPNKDMRSAVPAYDIAGNLLFQHSMDAGDRWMLNDAAGKPMFSWDNRGNFFVSSYDELHRPTKLELANPDHPNFILAGFKQYGESTAGPTANNLCGKTYRTFDQGGMVTNQQFDFKGNALTVGRRFASDYDADTDWKSVLALAVTQEPDALLMPESFTQITSFDALNRTTLQYNWHRAGKPVAVYEPTYSARGLLAAETLTVGATKQLQGYSGGVKTAAIQSVTYDAKGQRQGVTFGNDVVTTYTYDQKTFRLLTLASTRPKPGNLSTLQNLSHTYDPSGNITEIYDDAVPTEYFDNSVITSRKAYAYDALYRLTGASGREHAGQLSFVPSDNWNDCPFRVDYGANNAKAWRNYTQSYSYDAVGNILVMQHLTSDTATCWTRQYQYAVDSNRLLATGMGAATVDHYPAGGATLEYSYAYNAHGSMETLPHLPTMDWDIAEQLCHISRSPASQGTGTDDCLNSSMEAWYRYNASKQRTRKRVAKQGGIVEERLYLGGLEWYRRTRNGGLSEEIETLHLFDGQQRLLMLDQVIQTDRSDLPTGTLYRYTLSNHLGSSTVELDGTAEIISYEEYHPYGTTAYQSGPNKSEVKLKRYRYTGMERDEESGLNYHGARYYVPWLARWISADPTGIRDGVNLYRSFLSNPVAFRDTSGRQADVALKIPERFYRPGALLGVCRDSVPSVGDNHPTLSQGNPGDSNTGPQMYASDPPWLAASKGANSIFSPKQQELFEGTIRGPALATAAPAAGVALGAAGIGAGSYYLATGDNEKAIGAFSLSLEVLPYVSPEFALTSNQQMSRAIEQSQLQLERGWVEASLAEQRAAHTIQTDAALGASQGRTAADAFSDFALNRVAQGVSKAQASRELGPVATTWVDTRTGNIEYGLNIQRGKGLPPTPAELQQLKDSLHPILRARLEKLEKRLAELAKSGAITDEMARAGVAGTHSEIVGLNKLIQARELATGVAVTEKDLSEFVYVNRSLQGPFAGQNAPIACYNCRELISGTTAGQ